MASPTQWTWVWVDLGVGYGQGGLACCSSRARKELDTTERLNWTDSLKCPSEWVCFSECGATTDLLNEGNAQFDSLPDKLQGMPAVSHCFRWLLTPWHWLWTPILKWLKVHRFSTSIFCFSYLWLWWINSDDHYIYYHGQESLRRNGVVLKVNKRVWNGVLGYNLKNDRMISVHFKGKPFSIKIIQLYAPTTNAREEQGLLELTRKKKKKSSFHHRGCCSVAQ